MANISLITVPYDSGRYGDRMGRGPVYLLENGLIDHLRGQGHEVEVANVLLRDGFHAEGQALVQLQRHAVPLVQEALRLDRRVLILSGNCGAAALSAVSALGGRTTGVVWFDAHGDFNTPETSASGFLDGMALSILTGRCWPALAASFEIFDPVPEENIILIGGHALDPAEQEAVDNSAIIHISARDSAKLDHAMKQLSGRVERLYIHLDVDVLDAAEGRANSYACRDGLSATQLFAALKIARNRIPVGAASITSYDPECDTTGTVEHLIRNAVAILMG